MRITDLEVEGFGVWSGLRVERLGEGLNVLYGPNEAGKTTLLQFLRSMFYGFSPPRRRYLPPVHGGRGGGTHRSGRPPRPLPIGRHDNPLADGSPDEQVTLTAPDGTRQGEHFLKVLLSNIDEPVFNNVFAVGLREIQELATLGDTEAAQLLYNLSAGLDRVSLVEVLRELESSRNRMLDAAGKPCQVVQLLAEREKLRAEIEELGAINRRYGHLAAECDQLRQEITRLEEETNRTEQLSRVMELAVSLRERWMHRAALARTSALARGTALCEHPAAVGKWGRSPSRHARRGHRAARRRQCPDAETPATAASISGVCAKRPSGSLPPCAINEALWRQAARIEALKEQEPWITPVAGPDRRAGKPRLPSLEADLAAERKRLGFGPEPRRVAGVFGQNAGPAAIARQSCCASAASASAEADQAAAAANETAAIARPADRSGPGRPRRRATWPPRWIGRAAWCRNSAAACSSTSGSINWPATRPNWRSGAGSCSIGKCCRSACWWAWARCSSSGSCSSVAGLLMPASLPARSAGRWPCWGWPAAAAAAVGKVLLERSNSRQLDGCQKQLGVLQLQVQQAKADRDALDGQLPHGGGPIVSRLQAAEKELAAMEELTPLDTRRSAARQEAEAAARAGDRRQGRAENRPATLAAGLGDARPARGSQRAAGLRRFGSVAIALPKRSAALGSVREGFAPPAERTGCPRGSHRATGGRRRRGTGPGGPLEQLRQLAEAAAEQERAPPAATPFARRRGGSAPPGPSTKRL